MTPAGSLIDQPLFKVVYNGNGSSGGSVPKDDNNYATNDTVTVLPNSGGLSLDGATFEYWSTSPDGSADFLNPGNTLKMGSSDAALYAQWFITSGLTIDHNGNEGITAHYRFSYNRALQKTIANPSGLEPARTNAAIAKCESDYNLIASWFGNIPLTESLPMKVLVANAGGGASWGPPIHVKAGGGDANAIRSLIVAEVTEMLMKAQNKGWYSNDAHNEQSTGEGLSHFLSEQFQIASAITLDSNGAFNADLWLNSPITPVINDVNYGPRADFLNATLPADNSNSPASGCSVLFLYYLLVQLGFDISQIVAAAAPTLAGVYKNLTGDDADPYGTFKPMLDTAFPLTNPDGTQRVSKIPGPNRDNPYPLPSGLFLSTRRYIASLAPQLRFFGHVRLLVAAVGMRTLRPTLNSRRRAALI